MEAVGYELVAPLVAVADRVAAALSPISPGLKGERYSFIPTK